MIKGPKAILSSAISNALAEFFEVSGDLEKCQIESNLLKDAKIVLHNVRFKEHVTTLPVNSAGFPTIITINGCVDMVSFTWAWSVGREGGDSWVKDVVLTIQGAKFQVRLEHGKAQDIRQADEGEIADGKSHNEAYVNPSTIDLESAKKIKKEGGISGYVKAQVQMITDMLTLKLVGTEFSIILPPPLNTSDTGDATSSKVVVGLDEAEFLSYGREKKDDETTAAALFLRQRVNIRRIYSNIHLVEDVYPLIETFSYSVDATRVGDRFAGYARGLEVMGIVQSTDNGNSGLTLHAGTAQIEAILQLGVLVTTQNNEDIPKDSTALAENVMTDEETDQDDTKVSTFSFPVSSLSLVLFNSKRFVVSDVSINYVADGTFCSVLSERIQYESAAGDQAEASGVTIRMRPDIIFSIDEIESLYVSDRLLLSQPIKGLHCSYEGNTLSVRLDTINAVYFSDDSPGVDEERGSSTSTSSTDFIMPLAPCSLDVFVDRISLKKSSDGSHIEASKFGFYANPIEKISTQLAIQLNDFKSHILSLTKVNAVGTFPAKKSNVIDALYFSAESARVQAGHSSDEWSDRFQPTQVKLANKKAKVEETAPFAIRVPFANIEKMKVIVTWAGTGIKLKDTALSIKPFAGDDCTTSKDIVLYYTRACLSRVPEFISNANVLGLNVIDSTAVTYGTWLGMSAFGAGGGIAAITAVDSVKGAVAAGKRSRKVDENEGWRPGDFLRGVVAAAGEATRDGAQKRGKEDGGNAIDWAVGAGSNASEYVQENKTRLGAAGVGGGGFIVGMALGGPIGAVVGGLVASAAAGKTLETIEERSRHEKNDSSTKRQNQVDF